MGKGHLISFLFVAGIAWHLLALVGISLTMLIINLFLHGWLVWQKLKMWQSPSSQSPTPSETFGM